MSRLAPVAVLALVAGYACGGAVLSSGGDTGGDAGNTTSSTTGSSSGTSTSMSSTSVACPDPSILSTGMLCTNTAGTTCSGTVYCGSSPVTVPCTCEGTGMTRYWGCDAVGCGSGTGPGNACTAAGGICSSGFGTLGDVCPVPYFNSTLSCSGGDYCCAPAGDAGNDAGADSGSGTDAGTGDTDASCAPPPGGPSCTPGTVSCADAGCAVPSNVCCETDSSVCTPAGSLCTGASVACEEKGDCPSGEICCLNVTFQTSPLLTTSCQLGPTCPTGAGLGTAQICRSNAECANGTCSFWSCSATIPPSIIESCLRPAGGGGASCTQM